MFFWSHHFWKIEEPDGHFQYVSYRTHRNCKIFNIFSHTVSDAATLSFNGSQGMYVTKPEEESSQAEEISFRFRTSKPSGLLLRTWTPSGVGVMGDSIEMALIMGQLRVTVRIGDRFKVIKNIFDWGARCVLLNESFSINRRFYLNLL